MPLRPGDITRHRLEDGPEHAAAQLVFTKEMAVPSDFTTSAVCRMVTIGITGNDVEEMHMGGMVPHDPSRQHDGLMDAIGDLSVGIATSKFMDATAYYDDSNDTSNPNKKNKAMMKDGKDDEATTKYHVLDLPEATEMYLAKRVDPNNDDGKLKTALISAVFEDKTNDEGLVVNSKFNTTTAIGKRYKRASEHVVCDFYNDEKLVPHVNEAIDRFVGESIKDNNKANKWTLRPSELAILAMMLAIVLWVWSISTALNKLLGDTVVAGDGMMMMMMMNDGEM